MSTGNGTRTHLFLDGVKLVTFEVDGGRQVADRLPKPRYTIRLNRKYDASTVDW
jgi:hypothetical protein